MLLGRDPSRTALLFDFDGTLAPIVADPATAELTPGAGELLGALAQRFCRVGVVSGRPLEFLERRLGADVALSGLYGLESRIDGERREHPDAGHWRRVISNALADVAVPDGLTVEPKGPSLTVHFRGHDALADTARRWAAEVAECTGLSVRSAKASFELHPPVDSSKGTEVRHLAQGCRIVAYFGDDVGDLPAFEALDALAETGVAVVKGVCTGPEVPESVASAADVSVDGPAELVALLAQLGT